MVHRVCPAWIELLGNDGKETIIVHIFPYLLLNRKAGYFELIQREDGVSALSQRGSLTPSVHLIRSGVRDDETADGRDTDAYHVVRHLAFSFLFNRKQIVS